MAGKRHTTKHHVIPKSRGGTNKPWNIKDKWRDEQDSFHTLFVNILPRGTVNMLSCEAIDVIENKWTKKSGELDKHKLTSVQIMAWQRLFRNFSPKRAIRIIKEDWTLKWCFQFKECFKFDNPRKECSVLKLHRRGELK